jgi:hypothetical protein
VLLQPVNPANGWLADRWHMDSLPAVPAALYKSYTGDVTQAFWYFDKEMVTATEKYYAAARGKQPQYLGFMQEGKLLPFNPKLHARIVSSFKPMADGVTFHLSAVYTDTLRERLVTAHASAPVTVSRICGPVVKIDDTTFSIRFYRMGFNNPKRSGDIWLLAASAGDQQYKSTVQQFNMRIPVTNKEGVAQSIHFPALQNIKATTKTVHLRATSNQPLPVSYYVQEGPAVIKENALVITKLPPRTKFPVKVTVVAWQYGRSIVPKVQSALPVTQTFYIDQ